MPTPMVPIGYNIPNMQQTNQPNYIQQYSYQNFPMDPIYYPDYYYKQQQIYPNSYVYPSPPSSISSASSYEHTQPIDYSSLVSYTVSPSLKRKRRSTQSSVSGSEVFPCEVCGRVFHKQYNLRSHMKTHSDEKPFSCSKCDKRFARSHDKKRHELLHAGVKNFKCQGYLKDGTKWGCSKQFARSDALARHFRTEAGWLCIKPLMDEAKRLENGTLQFQQIAQQSQYDYE